MHSSHLSDPTPDTWLPPIPLISPHGQWVGEELGGMRVVGVRLNRFVSELGVDLGDRFLCVR